MRIGEYAAVERPKPPNRHPSSAKYVQTRSAAWIRLLHRLIKRFGTHEQWLRWLRYRMEREDRPQRPSGYLTPRPMTAEPTPLPVRPNPVSASIDTALYKLRTNSYDVLGAVASVVEMLEVEEQESMCRYCGDRIFDARQICPFRAATGGPHVRRGRGTGDGGPH